MITYNFQQAREIPLGTIVTVSDGTPQPAEEDAINLAIWKGHNFTGELLSVTDDVITMQYNTDIAEVITYLTPDIPYIFQVQESEYEAVPEVVDGILQAQVEQEQEEYDAAQFTQIRRSLATLLVWKELQDFKAHTADFGTLTEQQLMQRVPFAYALKLESGLDWPQLIAEIEARYWPQIVQIALGEAKAVMAKIAIENATTVEAKVAAANVEWPT